MTYQITDADIDAFTNGDCWALAREINKRTGWKVYALGAYPEYTEHYKKRTLADLDWVHVFVQVPDGRYLDADGLSDMNEMINRYEDHVFGKYDWEPDYFEIEEVKGKRNWDELGISHRIFPDAPVAKVAASLIRAYREVASTSALVSA